MLFETIVVTTCNERTEDQSYENCISPADVCGGFAVGSC